MSPEFLRFPSRATHDRFSGRDEGKGESEFFSSGILMPFTARSKSSHLHVFESLTMSEKIRRRKQRVNINQISFVSYVSVVNSTLVWQEKKMCVNP